MWITALYKENKKLQTVFIIAQPPGRPLLEARVHASASFSHVQPFLTPWTIARWVPPSVGFPRQEHCHGMSFLPPGDLLNPGIEFRSPALQVGSFPSEPQGKPKNTGVVAYPFSSGSLWPRNRTGFSSIAGGFFYQLRYQRCTLNVS